MRILELFESGTAGTVVVVSSAGAELDIGIILLLLKSTDFKCLSRQKIQTAKPIGKMLPVQV